MGGAIAAADPRRSIRAAPSARPADLSWSARWRVSGRPTSSSTTRPTARPGRDAAIRGDAGRPTPSCPRSHRRMRRRRRDADAPVRFDAPLSETPVRHVRARSRADCPSLPRRCAGTTPRYHPARVRTDSSSQTSSPASTHSTARDPNRGRHAPAARRPASRVPLRNRRRRGTIRWVEGIGRAVLVGVGLSHASPHGAVRIDAVASGALRRRADFVDARLEIDGQGDAAGSWRLSAEPPFSNRGPAGSAGFAGSVAGRVGTRPPAPAVAASASGAPIRCGSSSTNCVPPPTPSPGSPN